MSPPAVHQLTPTLGWGDAVGNQVRLIRRKLSEGGVESRIFAGRTDEQSRGEAEPAEMLLDFARRGDVVLVHHSIQSRFVPLLRRVARRAEVVVAYHNVTPPELVARFDPPLAEACRAGRDEVRELAGIAREALCFSEFSANDLRLAGFQDVRVVPYPIDFGALDVAPDPSLRAELDDGCFNVLFVGRGAPNKRIDQLLRVFTAFQRLYEPKSRLVIAGALDRDQPYGAWVHAVRETLRPDRVHMLGKVSPEQLSACFATASVYLSLSLHEGFGVPLVEAMHRGVPVVGLDAGAVAETLGHSGVVVRRDDPLTFARVLATLSSAEHLRNRIVAEGRVRARAFDVEVAWPSLSAAIEGAPGATQARPSKRR